MKKIDFLLAMVIVSIALFFAGKTTYNILEEKQQKIEEIQYTMDSLLVINILLEEYYMASENLLDSIFVRYCWPDAVDSYEYYESIENIESVYPELYNYMEEYRHN